MYKRKTVVYDITESISILMKLFFFFNCAATHYSVIHYSIYDYFLVTSSVKLCYFITACSLIYWVKRKVDISLVSVCFGETGPELVSLAQGLDVSPP